MIKKLNLIPGTNVQITGTVNQVGDTAKITINVPDVTTLKNKTAAIVMGSKHAMQIVTFSGKSSFSITDTSVEISHYFVTSTGQYKYAKIICDDTGVHITATGTQFTVNDSQVATVNDIALREQLYATITEKNVTPQDKKWTTLVNAVANIEAGSGSVSTGILGAGGTLEILTSDTQWIAPVTGIYKFWVIGGGGGAGGCAGYYNNTIYCGAGGGGGCFYGSVTLNAGTIFEVVIGAGGSGGTNVTTQGVIMTSKISGGLGGLPTSLTINGTIYCGAGGGGGSRGGNTSNTTYYSAAGGGGGGGIGLEFFQAGEDATFDSYRNSGKGGGSNGGEGGIAYANPTPHVNAKPGLNSVIRATTSTNQDLSGYANLVNMQTYTTTKVRSIYSIISPTTYGKGADAVKSGFVNNTIAPSGNAGAVIILY